MPTTTALTLARMRRNGFIAAPVERWLPKVERRADVWHFGDVLAAHPVRREIVLVQATVADCVRARLAKARLQPELPLWLRSGGKFWVMGWAKRGDRWTCKVVEVRAEDLAAVVVLSPPRRSRRPKQAGLFDVLETSA